MSDMDLKSESTNQNKSFEKNKSISKVTFARSPPKEKQSKTDIF